MVDLRDHLLIMLLTRQPFVADQMERNVKAFNQRLQRGVVANDGGNLNIQAAIGAFHQQISQAVGFFGD
ncbi:hypothetical protein D3C75_1316440 [compost metagenome]